MSHPDNTLKEIIENIRGTIHELNETNKSQLTMTELQNKEIDILKSKVEGLEILIYKIISMYQFKSAVDTQENQRYLLKELDKVRKL